MSLHSGYQLRSLAGPAARDVVSRKTVMPARSSATLCSAALAVLVAAGRTALVPVAPDEPFSRAIIADRPLATNGCFCDVETPVRAF